MTTSNEDEDENEDENEDESYPTETLNCKHRVIKVLGQDEAKIEIIFPGILRDPTNTLSPSHTHTHIQLSILPTMFMYPVCEH